MKDHSIDIWLAPVMNTGAYTMRVAGRRQLRAISRRLRRHLLSRMVNGDVSPNQWCFVCGDGGKPIVDVKKGLPEIHFNCSYSDNVVCVATSFFYPLGVDLASTEQHLSLDPTVFMNSEEQSELTSAIDMIRLWTLKEAFAKLTGRGLSLELDTIAFSLDPPQWKGNLDQKFQAESSFVEHRTLRLGQRSYALSLLAKYTAVKPQCDIHVLESL